MRGYEHRRQRDEALSAADVAGLLVALLVTAYLLYALFRGERL